MKIKSQFQGRINSCYLPYIVNSDATGMDPAEVEDADAWYEGMRKHAGGHSFALSFAEEDPYYGIDEATGLYAPVVTYTCTVFEKEDKYLPDPPAVININ